MSHADLLNRLLAPADADGRFHGVVVGIVSNNQDPDGMHRVKLVFPWLDAAHESHWARIATMMAGDDRGSYFLPEVDDEVLVAFELGSIEHPYVIGALWNGKDKPPEQANAANDRRTIKSRSGHVLRFDDTNGAARIEIVDGSGNNRITISSSDNSIAIAAQGDISITSATGRVIIKGAGIEIASTTDVAITANTTLDASASGPASLKGAVVNIN